MNIQITRTNSDNTDFQKLVVKLDKVLAFLDGEQHGFFAQFNKIDSIQHVLVAYVNKEAVGCGAIKKYEDGIAEIKRMYVDENYRGQGIASAILAELEIWAKELNFQKCILETGHKQIEAVGLYKKSNYNIIPNYGQYKDVKESICFEKGLG
ncbi:MAG: GNAT family N-acetyltransferase [Bacteroidia bacterium]